MKVERGHAFVREPCLAGGGGLGIYFNGGFDGQSVLSCDTAVATSVAFLPVRWEYVQILFQETILLLVRSRPIWRTFTRSVVRPYLRMSQSTPAGNPINLTVLALVRGPYISNPTPSALF